MKFLRKVRAVTEPQWDEQKVEHILNAKGAIDGDDLKELRRALDYWAYIKEISDPQNDGDVLDNVAKETKRIQTRLQESLNLLKRQRLKLVGSAEPKWDEPQVEKILRSKGPLTVGELEEIDRAIDYWEYINDISTDQDGDVLENVTKELERLGHRIEESMKAGKRGHLKIVGRFLSKVAAADTQIWYHLTDRSKFKLDTKFAPADNSISIEDRSGRPGIYLTTDVEKWVNGHGYWRPFVVEFKVDPSVKDDPGIHGRWGGEMFIPASSFKKLDIQRVIPLDAYAREKYGEYGWIEDALGQEFDTGKPIPKTHGRPLRGYKYSGPDVRNMPETDIKNLKQQLKKGVKLRR